MKPQTACLLICTSLILAGCKDEEPTAVEPELVAGRVFNVTKVDGRALPVTVQQLVGRAMCADGPLLQSRFSFRVDGILEHAVWTAQDARATVFTLTYTQFEDGSIRVGDGGESGSVSNGVLTIRMRTPFVCAPYTWEATSQTTS
jgi:hypothetical protein